MQHSARPKQLDMKLFPALMPKAFALPPQDKKFEESKQQFLLGKGTFPGPYGQEVKLEYNYLNVAFKTQFEQLIADYRKLGQELKPPLVLKNIGEIIKLITGGGKFKEIAEAEKPAAFKLFKQGMEDILFCMRTALNQAQTAQDAKSLTKVNGKIAATLNKLDEAFTHCTEQTTDSIMEEQLQWMPSRSTADHLFSLRTLIVNKVASQGAYMMYGGNVHRGTKTRLVAYQQGYGVMAPQHADPYPDAQLMGQLPGDLSREFTRSYTYEAICGEIKTQTELGYTTLLRNYEEKDLDEKQSQLLLAEMRALLDGGICQAADIITTVRTSATETVYRVNPSFKENLPLYCALLAPITLEKDGFVKPVRQFIKSDSTSLDVDGETTLTRCLKNAEFFTLATLLRTNPSVAEIKAWHLPNRQHETALSLALVTSEQKADDRPALLSWQRLHLITELFKYPTTITQVLTNKLINQTTYAMWVAAKRCPLPVFHLFWDTLISSQQKSPANLTRFVNQKDQFGCTALMHALKSSELARVEKLILIPGLEITGFESVVDATPEVTKIKDFLLLLQHMEKGIPAKRMAQFIKLVTDEKSPLVGGVPGSAKKNREEYKKLLTLLHARYGDKKHPHHGNYQHFLQELASKENDVVCLVGLKTYVPSIDLHQPRSLRLKTGVVEVETPLRAAIRDHDENDTENNNEELIEHLLKREKTNPHDKVGKDKESAWMLVARNGLFTSEQQEASLGQLIAGSRYPAKLDSVLADLAAADRSPYVFAYILSEIQADLSKDHQKRLGHDRVATATAMRHTFIETAGDEKHNRDAKVNLVTVGKQEALMLGEAGKLDVAKALGKVAMRPMNSEAWRALIMQQMEAGDDKQKNDAVNEQIAQLETLLYRVVASHQREKVERLLLETSELDFKQVFTIADIKQELRDEKTRVDKTDKNFVIVLMRLLATLHQSPPAYASAITLFTRLVSFVPPEQQEKQYGKLLTIIYRQCRMTAEESFCYEEIFKRLAAVETNVVGLNLIKKYIKIDLVRQLCLAASNQWTAKQFTAIWQELKPTLVEFKPLKTLVDNLVTDAKRDKVSQQLEKFKIVLSQFPVMSYLTGRSSDSPSDTALDDLINLLLELQAGHWEKAFAHYCAYRNKLSVAGVAAAGLSSMDAEIATIIKKQLGDVVLQKFSTVLALTPPVPGLFSIVQRIKMINEDDDEEKIKQEIDKIRDLFLQQVASKVSGSDDIALNFKNLLFLFYQYKNQQVSIFNSSLSAFYQSLLKYFSGSPDLQHTLIVQVVPFHKAVAAHLFCRIFLYTNGQLLTEKLLLAQLRALPSSLQAKLSVEDAKEILKFIYGELLQDKAFINYSSALAFFAKEFDIAQPISYYAEFADGAVRTQSSLDFALSHQYYALAEQIIANVKAGGSPLDVTQDYNFGQVSLVQMVELSDVTYRHRLVEQWLSMDAPQVVEELEVQPDRVERKKEDPEGPEHPEHKQENEGKASDTDKRSQANADRLMDTNSAGDHVLLCAISKDDENLALKLLKWANRIFARSPDKLTSFIWHQNKAKKSALESALNRGYKQLALEILLVKPIDRMKLPRVAELKMQPPGFTPHNIIRLLQSLENWSTSKSDFLYCIDSEDQVVQLFTMVEMATNVSSWGRKRLSNELFRHYTQHAPHLVSALYRSLRSRDEHRDVVLQSAMAVGQLELMQMIAEESDTVKADAWEIVLNNSSKNSSCFVMNTATRITVLDFFLANKFHLLPSGDLHSEVRRFINSADCDFLTFIKIFTEYSGELLKTSPQHTLLRKLLASGSSIDNCVQSLRLLILSAVDIDSAILPALLTLMRKKLTPDRVQQILRNFLLTQQQWPELRHRSEIQSSMTEVLVSLGGLALPLPSTSPWTTSPSLESEFSRMPLYHRAIWTQDAKLLTQAKEKKANIEEIYERDTPLSLALYNRQEKEGIMVPILNPEQQMIFVQTLLANGARLNVQVDSHSRWAYVLADDYVRENFCSFTAFLQAYQYQTNRLSLGGLVSHEPVFVKKQCFLHVGDRHLPMVDRVSSFAILLVSVSDAELKEIFTRMPKEKARDFYEVVDAFLNDPDQYKNYYIHHHLRLYSLLQHRYTLDETGRLLVASSPEPSQDNLLYFLIKNGSFAWVLELMTTNRFNLRTPINKNKETPLMMMVQVPCTDAKQRADRQTVITRLLAEIKDKESAAIQNELSAALRIAAASPHCDIEAFNTLLKACSPAVINQLSPLRETALDRAVGTKQKTKVQALLALGDTLNLVTIRIAAILAQQQKQADVVDLLFAHDAASGAHQLKNWLIAEYKQEMPGGELRVLAARSYYELYKDTIFPLAELPAISYLFYKELLRGYTSYELLLGDDKPDDDKQLRETLIDNRLELLQRSRRLNTALFHNMLPLDYALQKRSDLLVGKLLHFESLIVTPAQLKLVLSQQSSAFKEKWLPLLFAKFVQDSYRDDKDFRQIVVLLVEFYADLVEIDSTDTVDSSALWRLLETAKSSLSQADFQRLHATVLSALFKQLVARNDVNAFIYLFDQAGGNYGPVLMPNTDDTMVLQAVRQGWCDLLVQLSPRPDIFDRTKSLISPLEQALQQQDRAVAQLILEAKKSSLGLWPTMTPSGKCHTALTLAIETGVGDLAMCQAIVARARQECLKDGSETVDTALASFVNHKNALGKSALYLAAEQRREDIVVWLLSLSGIDAEAFCATTQRTAVLAAAHRTESSPPSVRPQLPVLAPAPAPADTKFRDVITTTATVASSVTATGEVISAVVPTAASTALPAREAVTATLVQAFAAKGQPLNEVDERVAGIAMHIKREDWHLAIQDVLALFDQYGSQDLAVWLGRLPFATLDNRLAFILTLNAELLKAEKIALLSQAVSDAKVTGDGVHYIQDHQALMLSELTKDLKDATLFFSQQTLATIHDHAHLKSLWPHMALATMRACHANAQILEANEKLINYIFTTTLESFAVHFASLIAVQEQLLESCERSEGFADLCQQVREIRTRLLQLAVDKGAVACVKILCEKGMLSPSLGAEYNLVDVNVSIGSRVERKPLIFNVLSRAQQETAVLDAKGGTNPPYSDMLYTMIRSPLWQDDGRDEKGATLLTKAFFASPDIFNEVLQYTRNATVFLLDLSGKTVIDHALQSIGKPDSADQQRTKAKILQDTLWVRFDECVNFAQELKVGPEGRMQEKLTETVKQKLAKLGVIDMDGLRKQTKALAGAILKFESAKLRAARGPGLLQPSTTDSLALKDMDQWQSALAGQPQMITADLLARAKTSPQSFVSKLADVWTMLAPSPKDATQQAANTDSHLGQLFMGRAF